MYVGCIFVVCINKTSSYLYFSVYSLVLDESKCLTEHVANDEIHIMIVWKSNAYYMRFILENGVAKYLRVISLEFYNNTMCGCMYLCTYPQHMCMSVYEHI